MLRLLAAQKAEQATPLLQRSAQLAWHRRWLGLLSVAAQTALAETLLRPGSPHLQERDAAEPQLGDLFAEVLAAPPAASRLPLRG